MKSHNVFVFVTADWLIKIFDMTIQKSLFIEFTWNVAIRYTAINIACSFCTAYTRKVISIFVHPRLVVVSHYDCGICISNVNKL